MAVVFRSVEPVAELIDEVFTRFGIPTAGEMNRPLHRSPALRALVALLQLDLDDWPFKRLLGVLKSNFFQPVMPEWTDARLGDIERTIRRLQIPRGRKRLIEQIDASKDQATLAVIQHLAAALDAMPAKATLPDWAKAWERLAGETGLLGRKNQWPVATSSNPQSPIPNPSSAWDRLMTTLSDAGRLAAWTRQHPPELDRRAALAALLDILDGESLGSADDEVGRVRILRGRKRPVAPDAYLFLAGLSEKAFSSARTGKTASTARPTICG